MTDPTQVVATREPLAVARAGSVSINQVFDAIMGNQINKENLAVAKELLAMSAERESNSAFVALQSELPVIVASSVIPNRGKYERFEDIMRVISPLLAKHGFAVSFSMTLADNRISETCTLSHSAGHSRSNSFAVRSGKADSDTQADCKAATTAKRNALCNALNIVIRQDYLSEEQGLDPRIIGKPITPDQAKSLRDRVRSTGSDEESFLKYSRAKTYEEIQSGMYAALDASLSRKEKPAQ